MRIVLTMSLSIMFLAPLSFGLLRAQNTDSEKIRFEEALLYFKKHQMVPHIEGIHYRGSFGRPSTEQKGEKIFILDLIIEARGKTHILKNCQVTDKFSCGQLAVMCLGGQGHYSQTLENWSSDQSPLLIYTYNQSKAGQCQGISGAF